jgi:hypothetical protein
MPSYEDEGLMRQAPKRDESVRRASLAVQIKEQQQAEMQARSSCP